MKKVLLVPDSFKETMSSTEVCRIMERAIKAHYPACEIVSIPVADHVNLIYKKATRK